MTKTSREYWSDRAISRLVNSESRSSAASVQIFDVYNKALQNILRDIQNLYDNYSEKGILDAGELKKAIGAEGKAEFLQRLKKQAKVLGIDPKQVYDERYLQRLTRLEALLQQIKFEIMTIAPKEEVILNKTYRDVVNSTYSTIQEDLKSLGVNPAFSTLDKNTADNILLSNWKGGNYSGRVWNNTGKLALELPTILGGAFTSGQSYRKTAKQLRERFDVSKYEATRLVRTESNYFHNQAELQSYIDDGIEQYEYAAVLDSRTSGICRHLDGNLYNTRDAVVGVNYPPMHVNCRSSTFAIPNLENYKQNKVKKEERLRRFDDFNNNEIKKKFRESMQAQMNPNKAVYDYNAEMNILTQSYKGDELSQRLGDLMARVPEDYPLRPALEHIAKLNGWKEPKLTESQIKVTEALKNADLAIEDLDLAPEQINFIADSGVKFQNARTGTDDVGGVYNPETNIISLDVANLKQFSKDLGNEKYINRVVQHELGHVVDSFAPQLRADRPTFSGETDFTALVEEEGDVISQYRMSETIVDKVFRDSVKNMNKLAYRSMMESGEDLFVGDKVFNPPVASHKYFTQPDEVFAESYSLFFNDPEFLKAKAPKLFSFISDVTAKKL